MIDSLSMAWMKRRKATIPTYSLVDMFATIQHINITFLKSQQIVRLYQVNMSSIFYLSSTQLNLKWIFLAFDLKVRNQKHIADV